LGIGVGHTTRALGPAAAIVPVQLLAWVAATNRGITPGLFVHTSKVTNRE
jgi:hypothetical protein